MPRWPLKIGSAPPAPVSEPRKIGRPVTKGWEATYLAALRETGGKHLAAEKAGIKPQEVTRRVQSDPDFAAKVDEMLALHADLHVQNLNEIAFTKTLKGSVAASIVRLKAMLPEEYIEKAAIEKRVIHEFKFTTDDARQTVRAMLADVSEVTRKALTDGQVIDAERVPSPVP